MSMDKSEFRLARMELRRFGRPSGCKLVRRQNANVPYFWLLLLLLLLINQHDQLSRFKLAVYGNLSVPNRTLPAELIVLENGSTTFISSSLEEFLDSTSTIGTTSASTSRVSQKANEELKNITHQSLSIVTAPSESDQRNHGNFEYEREREYHKSTSSLSADKPSSQKQQNSDQKVVPSENNHQKQLVHHPGEEGHNNNNNKKASGHHGGGSEGGSGNSSAPKPIPQHWQVKSLLNVTHDYPLEYSQIICGYVWPLMAAITLFTNLMIVFVLTQRDMRTPTNVVLTAIAIADIIPIVVPVPWFVYLFAMGNEKQVLYPPMACYFYQHSTRSVSEIFYFLSTWLNVLLAVQDYLTACWPKLAKKYCQIKVVIIEIVALTLLAFLLNLPQALKLVFKPVKFYYNGQLTWGCRALQAKWFKDLVGEYVALYDDIFTAIIVVFVDGGPAIALITLTALLIRQLHRQRIQGHLLMEQARTASKRRRERHRQQEYEASARVMIFVLLAFLAVKIPFATTYTLMIIQSRFEIHFVENLVDFQKAITLTDLVFVLSYPINFTIFCGCSKKFRHKCAQLLGECNQNTKTAKNRLMSSFSSSFNDGSDISQQIYSTTTTATANQIITNKLLDGGGAEEDIIKRDSLGTMVLAEEGGVKRDSSVSLLPSALGRYRYDSMTTQGTIICCNGINNRKLSQPQQHHHHQQQQQQQSPTSDYLYGNTPQAQHDRVPPPSSPIIENAPEPQESVQALAEDGLCVECIMRYEQMKRNQQHLRRQSAESDSSWQGSLPPPPPPLQFCFATNQQQQQQLPQIVTTRCASICERSSSEERNSQEPVVCSEFGPCSPMMIRSPTTVDGGGGGGFSSQRSSVSASGDPQHESQESMEGGNAATRGRNQTRGAVGSCARGSSDPGTVRGATRQQSIGYLNEQYLGRDVRSASHSNESMSMAGSRDGAGGDTRRRAETSSGSRDAHLRAPTLAQIENKHRSLSMSNSKLSALAGATGLLADIIKSTLLTTNASSSPSDQQLHQKHRKH